jgi:L-xylulokinase
VASQPVIDPRWSCRSFVLPGRWLHCGVSPASASNLEWFANELWPARAGEAGADVFAGIEREVVAALPRPREIWYLPFLYGSPIDNAASAALVGVRGWHSRGDLARALFEGVVLNHLWHVVALRSAFPLTSARLTGGGSRSAVWSQMFADALGIPVGIPAADETGALGAAICAGIGVGAFSDLRDGVAAAVRVARVHEPDPVAHEAWERSFDVYQAVAAALRPVWNGAPARSAEGPGGEAGVPG